ncbi:ABC transporter permease, partial [Micromonospora aurantiaca]|nr:ABC transporter permease [Micromonospora aurantiaca]
EVFTPASITILSAQFLPLILAAMGQSTVMLAGGIDLSLGSVLALAMAVFAVRAEDGVLTAAVLALAVAAATGAANGVLVAFAGLPPIIVTLAASFLWGGVTL